MRLDLNVFQRTFYWPPKTRASEGQTTFAFTFASAIALAFGFPFAFALAFAFAVAFAFALAFKAFLFAFTCAHLRLHLDLNFLMSNASSTGHRQNRGPALTARWFKPKGPSNQSKLAF